MSMTLEEARTRIGGVVIYRPPGWVGAAPAEMGVITAVGATHVFVRYHGDVTAKATRPEDLTWGGAMSTVLEDSDG